MRLIDADALKTEIEKTLDNADLSEYEACICVTSIYDKCIDNAPTVEPEVKKVPIASVTFDTEKLKELTDGIVESIKSGELLLQDERPKGEWKRIIEEDNDIECSICGFQEDGMRWNFCPNCGADMRGDAE